MTDTVSLTEVEFRALEILVENFGSMLTSAVPEATGRDVFGEAEPGYRVYRRLQDMGLVDYAEADPIAEIGFYFTGEFYITELGIQIFKERAQHAK